MAQGRVKFPFGFPPALPGPRRNPEGSAPVAPAFPATPRTPANGPIHPFKLRPPVNKAELAKLISPERPAVSVIFGTYNRIALLKPAIESIRRAVGPLTYEIVVTDGGSTDGTREWLAAQKDVVLVGMRCLQGAVRAFNQAWSVSRGLYIANFNDDAEYVGNCLEQGVRAFAAPNHENVGQFAFQLNTEAGWDIQYVNGYQYANFGIGKREVVERVCEKQGGREHYWNPIYHTYAADCEHSCWIWKMGLRVLGLEGARVADKGAKDALRERNEKINEGKGDSNLFWTRWNRPEDIKP